MPSRGPFWSGSSLLPTAWRQKTSQWAGADLDALDEDKSSHTFISFTWDDPRNTYFVISRGWWEKKGGAPYTYFIFNSADSAKTEKVVSYTKDKWVHIACTWRTGGDGFVRLYVNGLLSGEGHKKPLQAPSPVGKLYIGADIGTPLSKGRWGDGVLDSNSRSRGQMD